MNDDLNQAMAALAAAHRAQRAPISVEAKVLAEFDLARRRRYWKTATAGLVAAALAASIFVVVHKPAPVHEAAEKPEAPFVAIPYTVPLTPDERVRVVRMTLSPSALAAAGFPLSAIDPENGTPSDVLVDEDGRARAIRIISN